MLCLPVPHRTAAALLLAACVPAATGCSSWQTQSGRAQAVLAAQPGLGPDTTAHHDASVTPHDIRIATTDHPGMRTLSSPYVARDSLFGLMNQREERIGVPLDGVTAVQLRKADPGKTVGLVVGLTAAVAVGLLE